jgi:hypothetical protein
VTAFATVTCYEFALFSCPPPPRSPGEGTEMTVTYVFPTNLHFQKWQ